MSSGTLSDRSIRLLCASDGAPVIDGDLTRRRPLVEPYDPACVGPASIDLHLADEWLLRIQQNAHHIIDVRTSPSVEPLAPLKQDHLYLPPGMFALACTTERVSLPSNVVGRVEGRSSLGRLGIIVHTTAGFIDPGFDGRITLELANVGPWTVRLASGMRICQLSLSWLDMAAEKPYSGKYQGDRRPQSSRIWEDREWR